jgi:hypothetical protein
MKKRKTGQQYDNNDKMKRGYNETNFSIPSNSGKRLLS